MSLSIWVEHCVDYAPAARSAASRLAREVLTSQRADRRIIGAEIGAFFPVVCGDPRHRAQKGSGGLGANG